LGEMALEDGKQGKGSFVNTEGFEYAKKLNL